MHICESHKSIVCSSCVFVFRADHLVLGNLSGFHAPETIFFLSQKLLIGTAVYVGACEISPIIAVLPADVVHADLV